MCPVLDWNRLLFKPSDLVHIFACGLLVGDVCLASLSLPLAFSSRLHLARRFENHTCILDSVRSNLVEICSLAYASG